MSAAATRFFPLRVKRSKKRTTRSKGRRKKRISFDNFEISNANISAPLPDETDAVSFLELREWGLPNTVLAKYNAFGINCMFQWQAECLSLGKVLDGGNLVYSAPTSAGKTLVAEILLMKRVLETKKKALVILPFISLAREKMFSLRNLLQDANIRVEGFMGSHTPPGGFKSVDVAVCTIEKANSLVNRLLEEGTINKSLTIVVVDELHLLGDSSRGYLLELLLTKIRFMADKDVQIVGMSATLPNLDLLAEWLDADLYKTDFRPVPLTEHIKIGNSLYSSAFKKVKEINPIVHIDNDSDHLVYLSMETVINGHSVLIFCPTKNWCEKLAETIAKEFFNLGRTQASGKYESEAYAFVRSKLQSELNGNRLREVIEQLKRSPAEIDPILSRTIAFGVAFHHAGLTFDERDIIEGSFKQGILRVLVATSTLSSGVNLPARRVIVRCPFTFQNQLIDTLAYRQMIGRAGRKGVDTEGESILLCRENERQKVEQLVTSGLRPIRSCLVQGDTLCSSMKRAILEVVASGVTDTPEKVNKYASCTMLAACMKREADSQEDSKNAIQNCIEFLEVNEFIRLQKLEDGSTKYVASQLGLACLASSLSPDEGLTVFVELDKARKCFVLENELHIIYLIVPIYAAVQWPNMDWMNYLNMWESLTPDMQRVGEIIGVEERFLIRAMRGTINHNISRQARTVAVHQRFYTALALHDLVNEIPLTMVSKKYGASKGMLQSLQHAASTFAGMVAVFCSRLGWHSLELLIGQFQNRLQFGIQRELIDLCRLATLNGQRARILYNASIESVAQLANTSPTLVENILANSVPFESKKQGNGETARDAEERVKVRSLWITGMKGVTEKEAAEMIVQEARELLQKELGLALHWNNQEAKETLQRVTISPPSSTSPKKSERKRRSLESTPLSSKKQRSPKEEEQELSFRMTSKIDEVSDKEILKRKEEKDISGDFMKEEKQKINKEDTTKRVSWGDTDIFADTPPDVSKNNGVIESDDLFGDSINNTQDLEALSRVEKNNKSCPITPKYQICSEELDLLQCVTNDSSTTLDKVLEENLDSTIDDSFLERVLNTHMSETAFNNESGPVKTVSKD